MTPEEELRLELERSRSIALNRQVRRAQRSAQRNDEGIYIGYDPDIERHLYFTNNAVRSAASVSNAGLKSGDSVAHWGGFIDNKPAYQPAVSRRRVKSGDEAFWCALILHRKIIDDSGVFLIQSCEYWLWSQLGVVRVCQIDDSVNDLGESTPKPQIAWLCFDEQRTAHVDFRVGVVDPVTSLVTYSLQHYQIRGVSIETVGESVGWRKRLTNSLLLGPLDYPVPIVTDPPASTCVAYWQARSNIDSGAPGNPIVTLTPVAVQLYETERKFYQQSSGGSNFTAASTIQYWFLDLPADGNDCSFGQIINEPKNTIQIPPFDPNLINYVEGPIVGGTPTTFWAVMELAIHVN